MHLVIEIRSLFGRPFLLFENLNQQFVYHLFLIHEQI